MTRIVLLLLAFLSLSCRKNETAILGNIGKKRLKAFQGKACRHAMPEDWALVPSSDRLWITAGAYPLRISDF